LTYDPIRAEVDAQNTRDRVVVDRKTWSPAQIVAGGIGLFLTVMGAVAALRVGMDFNTTDQVLGLTHTLLMALIHIVVGIIFLGSAGNALGGRATMTTLGLVLIAFGLVYGIEGDSLASALGVTNASAGSIPSLARSAFSPPGYRRRFISAMRPLTARSTRFTIGPAILSDVRRRTSDI
jgi:hypothetical protein